VYADDTWTLEALLQPNNQVAKQYDSCKDVSETMVGQCGSIDLDMERTEHERCVSKDTSISNAMQ
jgi:hypothetical protein